jgi:hypothetical protein
MLNCMRVVIEDETDLQECYTRLEELDLSPNAHDPENWNDPVILAASQEWNAILNALLIWEQDHKGTVREEWAQLPSGGK